MRSSFWAARERMIVWVSESLVMRSSPQSDRDRRGRLRSQAAQAARQEFWQRERSAGVFALAEGGVGDLSEQAGVMVQGAEMAPVDLVGAGREMVGAEGGEAFQHRVDLELGGEEGVEGFHVIGRAAGHRGGSLVELHRVSERMFAPVAMLINSIGICF